MGFHMDSGDSTDRGHTLGLQHQHTPQTSAFFSSQCQTTLGESPAKLTSNHPVMSYPQPVTP